MLDGYKYIAILLVFALAIGTLALTPQRASAEDAGGESEPGAVFESENDPPLEDETFAPEQPAIDDSPQDVSPEADLVSVFADFEATDLEELQTALADEGVTSVVIPLGKTVTLEGNDKLTIPAGKTLTVSGSLIIQTTGDSITGSKGFCAVEVETGGTLIIANGGYLRTNNANDNFTNNGVYNKGFMQLSAGGSILIDCQGRYSHGVVIEGGGELVLAGTVDIKIPYKGDISNFGIYLSGDNSTLRVTGGVINIDNTGGAGIHTSFNSNPIEISGGTINVRNNSFTDNAHLSKGIELLVNTFFTGGTINIDNKGDNHHNSVNNPTGWNNSFGIWNRSSQFVIAGGTVNILNEDPALRSFLNTGPEAQIILIENGNAIDNSRVFHRDGLLLHGTRLEALDIVTKQPVTDLSVYVTRNEPGISGWLKPVTVAGQTWYPLNALAPGNVGSSVLKLSVDANGYYRYEENPFTDVFPQPKSTKTIYLTPSTFPAINIVSTNLGNLKAGKEVTGAGIEFRLTRGDFAASINPSDFAVSNLPEGLVAGTAVRTHSTRVTVPVTGVPTLHDKNTRPLALPSAIPKANVVGAVIDVTPTGKITLSAVAMGDGLAVVSAPTVSGTPTAGSIAVNPAAKAGTNEQVVEYSISKFAFGNPDDDWQESPVFYGLKPETAYYVSARTKASANYNAGEAKRSAEIMTGTEPGGEPPAPPQPDAVVKNLAELQTALAAENSVTIEIPQGETVVLEGNDTVEIPYGKTLTVSGSFIIDTTGDAITGSIGFCAVRNKGTLIIAPGGLVNTHNSNAAGYTNNGIFNTGIMKLREGGTLEIDCQSKYSHGVTVTEGGTLILAGDVTIDIPYAGDITNYGIYLSGTPGNQPTLRITGGEININNTGGVGIHTTPYSNSIEIWDGTININNDSEKDDASLTKGIELNTDAYFYGGTINIENTGDNHLNAVPNPTERNNTFGIWNRSHKFIVAGGYININNEDKELLGFFNDGQAAQLIMIEDENAVDPELVFNRGGILLYGTHLEVYDVYAEKAVTNYTVSISRPGLPVTIKPVVINGQTWYPLGAGVELRVYATGYTPYPKSETISAPITQVKTTFTVNLEPPEGLAIFVDSTGLDDLQVGKEVKDAAIVYTLVNGTFAPTIEASAFRSVNPTYPLPDGLFTTIAERTSDTVVTVPVIGTPLSYEENIKPVSVPSSVYRDNVTGATVYVTVHGSVEAGPVAMGDGAALCRAPAAGGTPAQTSVTVGAVLKAAANEQPVEYAISLDDENLPEDGWQEGRTFTGLAPGTAYYVWARTAETLNFYAGEALCSEAIVTSSQPVPPTLLADAVATDLEGLQEMLDGSLYNIIEIPAGETITLTGYESVSVPEGKTLIVSGNLILKSMGKAHTSAVIGRYCVENKGTLIVASGGSIEVKNSRDTNNTSQKNNGVFNTGFMEVRENGYLLIDLQTASCFGVTTSGTGVLELSGDVDIRSKYHIDYQNYGIYLFYFTSGRPTLNIKGGTINIDNTGGVGINTSNVSNFEISGGTINVRNNSLTHKATETTGINLGSGALFTGGTINIDNKGVNDLGNMMAPTGPHKTTGIQNNGQNQFVIAGGKINFLNDYPGMLDFFNDGHFAQIVVIEDEESIDPDRVTHRNGRLLYGTWIKILNAETHQPVPNSVAGTPSLTISGVSGYFNPVTIGGQTYYPLNEGLIISFSVSGGYQPSPRYTETIEEVFTQPKTTKVIYLTPPPPASISVSQIGLGSLKVGTPVTGASIRYTLSSGSYVALANMNTSAFAVSGLPQGLTAGAVTRSASYVSVAITGTPTAATAAAQAVTLPATIPRTNVTNATADIAVTGTLSLGPVAKGDGAEIAGAPAAEGSPKADSITVSAVTKNAAGNPANDQELEYARSFDNETLPEAGWQTSRTFRGLEPETDYYVWARTKENANYSAGPAKVSEAIKTAAAPAASDLFIKPLETAITVNKAKVVGARVPILSNFTVDEAELYTQSSPGVWDQKLENFTASVAGTDLQFVEIKPGDGAAVSAKAVKVMIKGKVTIGGAETWKEAELPIDLKVAETFPKITITATQLNLFYPNEPASITAVSTDGICSNVELSFKQTDLDAGYIVSDGAGKAKLGANPKAGTYKAAVFLDIAGYKSAPYKTAPTVSVKAVNATPKLKLTPSSVTLAGTEPAALLVESSDKKKQLSALGDVTGIRRADDNELTAAQLKAFTLKDAIIDDTGAAEGAFSIRFADPAAYKDGGTVFVAVDFEGGAWPVILSLSVKKPIDFAKASMAVKQSSSAWNMNHPSETTVVDLSSNQHNLVFEASLLSVKHVIGSGKNERVEALPPYIDSVINDNRIELSLNKGALDAHLAAKDFWPAGGKHKVRIQYNAGGFEKTKDVTITVANKAAAFSVSLKGNIDVANPNSEITATVKLSDTTSAIESVELLTAPGGAESKDFEVAGIAGNTFTIKAARDGVVPKVKQALSVRITLENGETLTSWTAAMKDKPISVTPAQSAGKASVSKTAVTLYKEAPFAGEPVELSFNSPAGVTLGDARVNQASVNSLKLDDASGFELEQGAGDTWELKFKGEAVPKLKNGAPLKSSYTIKLELWAEGAYKPDANGKPVALTDTGGKAKSSPTIVSIKVNIK